MRQFLAWTTGTLLALQLLADERDLARAFARWERRPSLVSGLHVVTSGLFLAGDIAEL